MTRDVVRKGSKLGTNMHHACIWWTFQQQHMICLCWTNTTCVLLFTSSFHVDTVIDTDEEARIACNVYQIFASSQSNNLLKAWLDSSYTSIPRISIFLLVGPAWIIGTLPGLQLPFGQTFFYSSDICQISGLCIKFGNTWLDGSHPISPALMVGCPVSGFLCLIAT